MTQSRRLRAGGALLVLVVVVGVPGYMLIENLRFIDALYLTVITISTVGFSEPLGGFSDAGRMFTLVIVVAGVGSALYTASAGIEIGLEAFLGGRGQRRRMEQRIASLENHFILCGFGRVGRNVWQRLRQDPSGPDTVVIEVDPDKAATAREMGAIVVEGDATHDDVLDAAGLDRARALIASVRSDADNLVIVLSARSRNSSLLVIARAAEAEAERKLLLAGADRVVAPQVVGALRLAALATRPDVADFIDLMVEGRVLEFRVERFEVHATSAATGRSLGEAQVRQETGTLVLAVQEDGRIALNPGPDVVLRAGQVLYGIGTPDQVDRMRALICEPA